ncbi:hypothetical protein DASC09_011790 [Saccharomycopsis crataegensis]|uniref:D-isomer specific 2-hydroxyacid dehydrogenase NAD-binding domain-containing protein n=1 Tax=Saccharomycopsis crataegensis TaxID=43959 RepID=A0AAV5QHL5_9ASCO|nr:hypothetical protein DASC09_011790 [Saccharomycopsis crataegensis]
MAKPLVLQLGGPIRYNLQQYSQFSQTFDIVEVKDLARPQFKQALSNGTFGQFYAVYRPFWNDGFQMGQWDKELIDLLPSSCKIIAMAGAGFDWIDIDYLSSKGIVYCNGGWGPTEAVGDNAIWHILSTFRNFCWSFKAAASCDKQQFLDAHTNCVLTAFNPMGHTLGIIGMGKIGYRIAEKANKGLAMKIAYYDLFQRPREQERAIEATYYKNLEELLAVSDCVVLATPAFADKFMNRQVFSKFKKGARFVNIARGKLVDTDALVDAINSGHIYAAGLDVFYDEPQVPKQLAELKTVSLTCHNAGGSISTWIFFEKSGMDNISSFYRHGKAVSPVNLGLLNKSKL